ncbi:Trigger factor [Candidatus Erwinia haradaeae]|uniref:Trigger factor n=1 Tax=Candidatus Erwinia haradaeae TaxID=1922217 RepID=A0A451DKI1_9GAMM|nr:trigger factor [Candidatus Erwinia haradaeae]VFP87228.1 Trigger factor [Candidatus Erwinia haradaeae]
MKALTDNAQDLNNCITLTIDKVVVEKAVKKKLVTIAKKLQIDGFRPGKAPLYIIKQRYGHSVRQDVIDELMQSYFMDIMIKNQLNPYGSPMYIILENDDDKDVTFSVKFNVYPTIEIQGVKNIKIEKPVITITQSDVDAMIQVLRQQKAIWKETNTAVRTKDRVTIDFSSSKKNNASPHLQESNLVLIIGDGQMISAFEEGIIGHKAGEHFTSEVSFPQNYNNRELQGQTIEFEILLKKVEVSTLPEITTEFIKQFGVKEGSLEALRKEVRQNMQRELKNAVRRFIKSQVLTGLVQENHVDIPDALVHSKAALWKNQTEHSVNNNIQKNLNNTHIMPVKEIKHHILASLLFNQVIHTYNITANKDRVRVLIEEIASAYENSKTVIAQYQANTELMQNICNADLEDQAVEAILDRAQVIEKHTTFQEFMYLPITN